MPAGTTWDEGAIVVTLPSGADFRVDDEAVADQAQSLVDAYKVRLVGLDHPSDLQDLDLIIMLETHNWRFNNEISMGRTSGGSAVNVKQLQEFVKANSTEIRRLKDQLGIDKKTRDRTQGDGSTAEFIGRLTRAGRQMNILRCAQLYQAIELAQQLRTLTTVYYNGDDEERVIFRCTEKDILRWIADVFDPTMQEIDDYFRTHEASIWVRHM